MAESSICVFFTRILIAARNGPRKVPHPRWASISWNLVMAPPACVAMNIVSICGVVMLRLSDAGFAKFVAR